MRRCQCSHWTSIECPIQVSFKHMVIGFYLAGSPLVPFKSVPIFFVSVKGLLLGLRKAPEYHQQKFICLYILGVVLRYLEYFFIWCRYSVGLIILNMPYVIKYQWNSYEVWIRLVLVLTLENIAYLSQFNSISRIVLATNEASGFKDYFGLSQGGWI